MEFASNIVSQKKGLAQDFEDYASDHHLQVPLVRGWNGAEYSGLAIE